MNVRFMCRRGVSLLLLTLLMAGGAPSAFGQATAITSMGFGANETGGGTLNLGWTTGNLGNTWGEGEWVPYQLVISNVQTDYPGLVGLDTITMSFDFTGGGSARFIDLVRSIQLGTAMLDDTEGWPADDGSAYPMGTRPDIENAQNDVNNNSPLENEWTGFHLLDLPTSQINLGPGLTTDAEHEFFITPDNVRDALDALGLPYTVNTIVIYYQLHESRTFVWSNMLQSQYGDPANEAYDWGGYLYALAPYATDMRNGAGFVPGSSGHVEVEFAGGAKTVPIPIPPQPGGAVSGLKWLDENGNAMMDGGEPTLSGWPIYVEGTLEGIAFEDNTLTDGSGNYSFPNLTPVTTWTIKEASRSDSGYMQTYPPIATVVGVGTGVSVFPPPPGVADWGWDVELSLATPTQEDMDFGNMLCEIVIACPADVTVDCSGSTDPSITGFPGVTFNCGPVDTSYSDEITPGDCDVDGYLYEIARRWTVIDGAGNEDNCVQYIQVTDTTPPVISCPTDQTYECDASWSFGTPTATDDCDTDVDISILSTDSIAGSCPQEYQMVRTWVATDDCGNADTCAQTITIQDTTPPSITCPADMTFECDAVGSFGVATATDNCDADPTVAEIGRDSTAGSCPQEYVLVITWQATDACGNSSTCEQTITVEDTTPPSIVCPADVNASCDAIPDFGVATATDNCDTDVDITYTDVVVSTTCPLQIARTWTATDDCGNSASCVQSIIVDDETPPVLTCPADLTFECDAVSAFGTATATDNCDPSPVVTQIGRDSTAGTCPQEYTLVITWQAMDACGNTSTCQQTITVEDTTPPVISCPTDRTFECDAVGSFGVATAMDNCDADPTVAEIGRDSTAGSCPQEYVLVITWRATDACGNSSTCQQTITVDDTTPPEIACAADKTIECGAMPVFDDPTATDNCDPAPVISVESETSEAGPGVGQTTYIKTWVATDACGNESASCSQRIIQNPCGGRIAPTQTSCEDFVSETAGDITQICYGVKGRKINNTAPGVFFYYTKVFAPSSSFSVDIVQTNNNTDFPFFALAGEGQAVIWGGDCVKYGYGAETSQGQVSFNISGATVGQVFILSCKYQTSSVHGTSVGNPPAVVHYDFHTEVGGIVVDADEDGLDLEKCLGGADVAEAVNEYQLDANYPNPFNPVTQISFSLPREQHVTLEIFNVVGQRVEVLVDGVRSAGRHTVQWNADEYSSGMYFYRIQTSEFVETRKMLLLK